MEFNFNGSGEGRGSSSSNIIIIYYIVRINLTGSSRGSSIIIILYSGV